MRCTGRIGQNNSQLCSCFVSRKQLAEVIEKQNKAIYENQGSDEEDIPSRNTFKAYSGANKVYKKPKAKVVIDNQ